MKQRCLILAQIISQVNSLESKSLSMNVSLKRDCCMLLMQIFFSNVFQNVRKEANKYILCPYVWLHQTVSRPALHLHVKMLALFAHIYHIMHHCLLVLE